MIVAESDVLTDALRGRAPSDRLEFKTGALATSAISAFELRSGATSADATASIEALLAAMMILPFDERAAERTPGRDAISSPRGRPLARRTT